MTKATSATEAEMSVNSPSSMKTAQAPKNSANDNADQPSPEATPKEVAARTPASETSVLSETPLTCSSAVNGIPEVDDANGREAVEALRQNNLLVHVESAAAAGALVTSYAIEQDQEDDDHGLITQPDDDNDFGRPSDLSMDNSDPLPGSMREIINRQRNQVETEEGDVQRRAASANVATTSDIAAKQDEAAADEDTVMNEDASNDHPDQDHQAENAAHQLAADEEGSAKKVAAKRSLRDIESAAAAFRKGARFRANGDTRTDSSKTTAAAATTPKTTRDRSKDEHRTPTSTRASTSASLGKRKSPHLTPQIRSAIKANKELEGRPIGNDPNKVSAGGGRSRRRRLANDSDVASSKPKRSQEKKPKARAAGKKSTPTPRPNDEKQTNKRKHKASPPNSFASTNGQRIPDLSASSDDSPVAKGALPDMKRTVAEKLRCCQSVLHSDEVEDMFTNSSRVKKHVQEISLFLKRAMNAYGGGKKSRFYPSSMYICGGPGTGKTTTLNKCIDTCSKEYSDARFLFRNVVSCGADGPSQASRLLQDINNELLCSGDASYDEIEKCLACPPGKAGKVAPFVLVLDEIDMLLSGSIRSDGKLSGGNKLIERMLRWAADPHCAFSLIGISNAVDDDRTRRLEELGDIHKKLVFRPYKEEDLISILEARIGTQIIAEPALKMVSRKVAAGSGDARKALDMTAKAVRKCETSLSEEDLQKSTDVSYPIVELPHMMRSIREGLGMKHADAITALPQAAKIVLCVAVALSTVSPAWKVIKMKDLKKYCAEASRHGLMERLNIDHLFDIVQMLSDSGLLLSGDGCDFRYAIYSMDIHEIPLMLGVQLDDVECALEKTLLTEPFYKSMVEYVKKNHRHPTKRNS